MNKNEDLAYQIRNMSLGDALKMVFKRFKLRIEDVSFNSGIDKRNLYRYFRNQCTPPKRSLVQLLIGMKVPMEISCAILYAAGYVLNSSEEDVFFAAILELHKFDIYEVNEMIEEYNAECMRPLIKYFKLN